MFVFEIGKITYPVLIFTGLKLETISLSKLRKLPDDWLCERSLEKICYLVTVRSKEDHSLELILIRLGNHHFKFKNCRYMCYSEERIFKFNVTMTFDLLTRNTYGFLEGTTSLLNPNALSY
jgi:hypothetical protein